MGEEKEEGAATGVTVVNNIDLSTVESELKNLHKVLSGDEKTMIKNQVYEFKKEFCKSSLDL